MAGTEAMKLQHDSTKEEGELSDDDDFVESDKASSRVDDRPTLTNRGDGDSNLRKPKNENFSPRERSNADRFPPNSFGAKVYRPMHNNIWKGKGMHMNSNSGPGGPVQVFDYSHGLPPVSNLPHYDRIHPGGNRYPPPPPPGPPPVNARKMPTPLLRGRGMRDWCNDKWVEPRPREHDTPIPHASPGFWDKRKLKTSRQNMKKKEDTKSDEFDDLLESYKIQQKNIRDQLAKYEKPPIKKKEEPAINKLEEPKDDTKESDTVVNNAKELTPISSEKEKPAIDLAEKIEQTTVDCKTSEQIPDEGTESLKAEQKEMESTPTITDVGNANNPSKPSPAAVIPETDADISNQNGEEKTEDDLDVDLDELMLRRIALESSLKKETDLEEKKPDHKAGKSLPSKSSSTSSSKSPISKSPSKPSKSSPSKPSPRNSRHHSRSNITRRGDNRNIGNDKRNDEFRNRPTTNVRARPGAGRTGSNHGQPRSRKREPSKQELQRRRKEEEKRQQEEDRRKTERQREDQTREIQKILTLDDASEQVSRFLALLGDKRYPSKASKQSPTSAKSTKSLADKKAHGHPDKPALQDNYEEVAMDIDSDPGSPAISTVPIAPNEDYQLVPDTDTIPQTAPYMTHPFDMQSNLLLDTENIWDLAVGYPAVIPYPTPEPVIPYSLLPPPPPPPLPSEEVAPPPPLPEEPPPPLPLEPPPDMAPPPPPKHMPEDEDEDIFGDEAAMLRAELLRSMAIKKREQQQKEKIKQEIKSEEASPASSRSISPAPLTKSISDSVQNIPVTSTIPRAKKRQKQAELVTMAQVPIQAPVVINLNDDSSDEEDVPATVNSVTNLLGGLDSFLNEARMSVNSNQNSPVKEEDTLQAEVNKYEEEMNKQRISILQDQAIFKGLLSKASKYHKSTKQAQDNILKLKEQLVAAEKVASAHKEQFEKVRKHARAFRANIYKKQEAFKELEEKALQLGQTLYGMSYKPRTVVAVKASEKHKLENISVTLVNEKAAKKVFKGKENKNIPVESIDQEKEKLQRLADEYAKKIQILKQAQAKKKADTEAARRAAATAESKRKSAIPRIEKIAIDLTESASESESEERPNKRRRSLMELNTSTKPNLSPQNSDGQRKLSQSDPEVKSSYIISDDKTKAFPLPGAQRIARLAKLQDDHFQTLLSSCTKNQTSLQSSLVSHWVLLPQCQQIPSFQVPKRDTKPKVSHATWESSPLVYKSPLLHFRSYRFSPYYRTRANLTLSSATFSNKINPKKVLCKYDLQGTCHDEECGGLHNDDIKMCEEEVLQDIVSYHPAVAGISSNTPIHNYSKILGKFVSNSVKQHQGKLTSDQLMVLMVSQVSEKSGHSKPHNLFMEPRKWRQISEDRKDVIKDIPSDNTFDKIEWHRPTDRQELDNVIGDQDLRYFVSDSSNIQDMESAVLDNPHNVPIWLKLAHKKLHDPNSGNETCLDHALNVLARGLEENKDSADLWQSYLSLYAKHKESSDLQQLCETALEYTQSYPLWWQYLNMCTSCQQKQEVCDQMLEYIRLAEDHFPQDVRSHWVLEVILFKTSLYVWTGKFKMAIKQMQSVLKTGEKLRWINTCLVTDDQCLLWVSYVHLKEMKCLPPQLYDPLNQMSGRIVNKTNIMIEWTNKESLTTAVTILIDLLHKAINCCIGRIEVNNPLVGQGCILYLNLFNLLKSQERYEEAAELCRPILEAKPTMIEVWLCVAELYALYDDEQTRQVFADALAANEFCAKLYHYSANFELSQREEDKALECLEQSVISYFDVTNMDKKHVDPNQLFCVLLDETVPLNFQPPPYKEGVTEEVIKDDLPYLWLNYCILLELQGDDVQAVEAYETALSTLSSVVDITRVWSSYIGFQNRRMKLQGTIGPKASQNFYDLVRRSVSCIPTKYEVPFCEGTYWFNYRHVNTVIQHYMTCVSSAQQTYSYCQFVSLMPDNMDLLLQACGHAVCQDDLQTARGLCTTASFSNTPNLQLWNMLISLTSRLEGKKEVRQIFHKAVQALPYSASLWKDYLRFEVIQRSSEVLPKIIQKCQDLGVSIQEYADFLTKPS